MPTDKSLTIKIVEDRLDGDRSEALIRGVAGRDGSYFVELLWRIAAR